MKRRRSLSTGIIKVGLDLLLDTHIVIWTATAPKKISKRLLAAIESADKRLVNHVTVLEVKLKYLKNKKLFPFGLDHLEQVTKRFLVHGIAHHI
jgi:PIN domain nuclease of toxin-antitoxin system